MDLVTEKNGQESGKNPKKRKEKGRGSEWVSE